MSVQAIRLVDVGTVHNAIGAALVAIKEWSLWLGREVVNLSFKGLEWGRTGLMKVVQLLVMAWNSSRPYLLQLAAFLATKPAVGGLCFLAAVLVLRMALNDTNIADKTARYSLGMLALSLACFGTTRFF